MTQYKSKREVKEKKKTMELAQDHTRGWFENLKEKLGFYGSYVGEDGKRHSKRTQVSDNLSDSDDESLVEAQNYQARIEHSSDEDESSQNFNNGRPPTPPPKDARNLKDDQDGYDKYSSDEDQSSQNFNNGRPPTPPPKKIIKPGQPGSVEYQRYLASQRV